MALHSPLVISSPPHYESLRCSSSPNIPPLDYLLKKGKKSSPPLYSGSRAAPILEGAIKGFQSARLLPKYVQENDAPRDIARDAENPRKRRKRSNDSPELPALNNRVPPVQGTLSRTSPRLGRYVLQAVDAIDDCDGRRPDKDIDLLGRDTTTQNERISLRKTSARAASMDVCVTGKSENEPQHVDGALPSTSDLAVQTQACDPRLQSMHSTSEIPNVATNGTVQVEPAPKIVQIVNTSTQKDTRHGESPNTTPVLDHLTAWSYVGRDSGQEPTTYEQVAIAASHETFNQGDKVEQANDAAKKQKKTQKKTKLSSKSSRTVTSVAIARYQEASGKSEEPECVSLWDQSGSARARKLLDPTCSTKTKGKAKAKGKENQASKRLPDPEIAQSRAERQEFFFGSSSQLTKDEPLAHIQDLQQAIKASEGCECDTIAEKNASKELWTSGARGNSVPLLEAEELPQTLRIFAPKQSDDPVDGSMQRLSTASVTAPRNTLYSISVNLPSPTPRSFPKPEHRSFSTEAANARPRGRPRTNTTVTSDVAQQPALSRRKERGGATLKSPAKARKRRKKGATPAQIGEQPATDQPEDTATIDDVDISDDNHAGTGHGKPRFGRKKDREGFVANKAATMFPSITKAVKEQTIDSSDPKCLTWHEKILLYDPIVVEDLTSWLQSALEPSEGNAMPVAELKPWMVQLWCEEHSICCLWKEGLRGGVKLKY